MAIRTIEYNVSADGISPQTVKRGGVQGDHRATEIRFTLNTGLVTAIKNYHEVSGYTPYYRFDGYDGAGGLVQYDSSELVFADGEDTVLVLPLENRLTCAGGRVTVYLVITAGDADNTVMELYSFPAVLDIAQRTDGSPSEEENRESLTTLAENAKRSAENAETAEKNAAVSATSAKNAADTAAGYAEELSDIKPRMLALETTIGNINATLASVVDVEE